MTSFTEENYLKTLFHLGSETGEVNVKDLSKVLGIKMPTVTSMMKKFAEKELVQYESYRPLKLTAKGKKEAGLIIRKHRLTEMYLVEKMGFGWEEVHEIAEQVEHIHAPAFFEKMSELLGHPKIDPHGSPIPDKEGRLEWKEYDKLSDCRSGDRFELQAIMKSEDEFLTYLNKRELKLGLTLKVDFVEPFDGSMTVSYEQRPGETLSLTVCERLLGNRLEK
jgi:DtxR family Mn-dependent transcriptional regulator